MDWENAIFGPGWVWSMLSLVLVVGSLLGLYRQLRLQSSQAAIEQLERIQGEWASERMARSLLALFVAIEAGTDPADIPDRPATEVGDFWEKLGYLTRTGHVDRRLVHEMGSSQVQRWWARLGPYVLASRERDAKIWTDFEWLAHTMAQVDAKQGVTCRTDKDSLAARLPEAIAELQEAIEIEEARRTVPVRLVETPVPVTSVRLHSGDGQQPAAPGDTAPVVA